jgi:methylmalonyl-CoA/ethylmalonyl-CoA epimerase
MKRIEHLGIAVSNLNEAEQTYTKLFGPSYKKEIVESEAVATLFFKAGENKIELLEALSPESAIAKFIEKRGQGLHHVAFEVEDIEAEMQRLKSEGFQLLSDKPKKGADNKLVCFVHPKNTNGVLIELTQEIR